MGRKCCVATYKGNNGEQTKVKVYRLPGNLQERKRWLTIIPRDKNKALKHSCTWKTLSKIDCDKKNTINALAEVKNLLTEESNHLLEKSEIKNFRDISVEIISCNFNGVEIITNSSENEVLL